MGPAKHNWLTKDKAIGFLSAGVFYLGCMFIGDVRASMATTSTNDKAIAVHDMEIKLLSAMRPQVFEIHNKVDSIEKGFQEMRAGQCGKRQTGEK